MKVRTSITKCDLVVAAICLFFILANARILTAGGRERSKLDVCMANLRVLTAVWNLYADENADKIAGTYTTKCVCLSGVYPSMNCTANPPVPSTVLNDNPPIKHHSFPSWVEQPHQWDTTTEPSTGSKSNPHRYDLLPDGATGWDFESHYVNKERDDQHAIACGTLWKYIKDYKIYRCPNSDKDTTVSYVGSDGLNGIYNSGPGSWCNQAPSYASWKYPSIYIRSQIQRPVERIVFICLGERVTCSWNLINTATRLQSGCWSSTPPVRHNNGATFSFADGHTEYHKWLGRALEVAKKGCVSYSTCPASQCSAFPCDKDLFYMAKGVCGSVGPNPSSVSGSNPAFVPPPGCDIE